MASGIVACPLIWRGVATWVLLRDPGGTAQLQMSMVQQELEQSKAREKELEKDLGAFRRPGPHVRPERYPHPHTSRRQTIYNHRNECLLDRMQDAL